MRLFSKSRNCDIYPSYQKVLEAKLKCRPDKVDISEKTAQVPLQNLLNHTAKRIILMQEEVFTNIPDISSVTLIASYGFDGTTGHSMYKQKFQTECPDSFDHSLFVTTLIPLKLIDAMNRVIWINRTPQSVRFCRPLKIEIAKESTSHVLAEKNNLDLQIQKLLPFVYTEFNDRQITVSYDLHMTLIDGKVLNILSGTNSCQCCSICGAKPTQFLTTKNIRSDIFQVKSDALQYGVSPLHAWIRFMEFVLKISYKLEIQKWRATTAKDKEKVLLRKHTIQKRFFDEMGLLVDKPKQNGFGSTNDGNTARRAFSNIHLMSSILDFDKIILERFHVILIAISCEYEINCKQFQEYCEETASLYMEKYPWYPMSATVHKILVHGFQIIAASVLPVGSLGENASEARNKFYKEDRRSHARRDTRLHNLTDVYNRAMDTSDPFLSSIFLKKRCNQTKLKNIPQAVLELLSSPNIEILREANLNNDISEDECDEMEMYSFELETENN